MIETLVSSDGRLIDPNISDITIIGGGPVGLFAAFYAGQRHMTTRIIDSLEELGGQLAALYPEKFVFDVAGFPKIYARDLARNLIEQAMATKPSVVLGQTVRLLQSIEVPAANEPVEVQRAVNKGARIYKLTTDHGIYYTRTVLIAAGGGAFTPRKLPLKEAAALEGRGIYYTCRNKETFKDKRLLIVGGGDSAIDWALNLQETAAGGDGSGITLIHRRNGFRAHEQSVRKLQTTKTPILTFWEIESLISQDGVLKGAVINNSQTKEKRSLEIDAILVQIGFLTSLGPIKDWPIKTEKGAIPVDAHMETELPGIFAAGDVAAFNGKLKLIATGFSEAVVAVNFAKTRIDPEAKAFPGHSSEATTQAEREVMV